MNIRKELLQKVKWSLPVIICLTFIYTASSFNFSPKIDFTEHDHDFGNVSTGQELSHKFYFKNSGTGRLEILQLFIPEELKSRTMSSILNNKMTYEPGESGEITLSFNTKDFQGDNEIEVIVESNDPVDRLYRLHVDFDVRK